MASPTPKQMSYNANALFYAIKARESVAHNAEAAEYLRKAMTWVNAIDPDAYDFSGDDVTMRNPDLDGGDDGNGVTSVTPKWRTMFDSTNAFDIPDDAESVAGYIDGRNSQWSQSMWNRFPNAKRITVLGDTRADIADCENGAMTPENVRDWLDTKGSGIVYANRSTLPRLEAVISGRNYRLWIADWTGEAHMADHPKVIATQYANPSTSGGHYDLSALSDDWR